MVGCGNSKMSEDMTKDGYPWVTNIDIANVVVDKMRTHYANNLASNEFATIDATRMSFRDNSYDFCIDKGTFDALACGCSSENLGKLLREMMRVNRVATILISSGTPEKRMNYFNEHLDCEKIEHFKI